MHGLFIRAAQNFVTDTLGARAWLRVQDALPEELAEYSPFSTYEAQSTNRVLEVIGTCLAQPVPDFLEDLGTYLVAHPKCETTRRLLRFGGESFAEALHSLPDLKDRARLALTNLELPEIQVEAAGHATFLVGVRFNVSGAVHVLAGVLRALADDYGVLVLIEKGAVRQGQENLTVSLLDAQYADDRGFRLSSGRVEIW